MIFAEFRCFCLSDNFGFWKFRILEYWVLEISDFEILGFGNFWFWKFLLLENSDFEILGFGKFRIFGFWFWVFYFGISKFCNIRFFSNFWFSPRNTKKFCVYFLEKYFDVPIFFLMIDRSRWDIFKNMLFFPLFSPFFFPLSVEYGQILEGTICFLFLTHW